MSNIHSTCIWKPEVARTLALHIDCVNGVFRLWRQKIERVFDKIIFSWRHVETKGTCSTFGNIARSDSGHLMFQICRGLQICRTLCRRFQFTANLRQIALIEFGFKPLSFTGFATNCLSFVLFYRILHEIITVNRITIPI